MEEFDLTKGLKVVSPVELQEGETRRTKQSQDIPSRDVILQFLSLLFDQLHGDLVSALSVLLKSHHPRTSVPLKNPGNKPHWGPPKDIHHEYMFPRTVVE